MSPGREDTPSADLRAPDTTGEGTPVELLLARRLNHPALPDPTVVLVPESSLATTSRQLARLGFRTDGDDVPAAERPAPPMRFADRVEVAEGPGSDAARDIAEQLAFAARTRLNPDAVSVLAAELAELAPRWLADFWDAVFDLAMDRGAHNLAARAFEAALDAERDTQTTHGEPPRLDRAVRAAVAGLCKAQLWARYAEDLTARNGPNVAWELFRTLCVRQTRGGAPPWSGMVRLAHKLARASGLPREAEARRFIHDLIRVPGIRRAPPSFWREARAPLAALLADKPEARRRVLDVVPEISGAKGFWPFWLSLIEDSGAVPLSEPGWSAASWFERMLLAFWDEPDCAALTSRLLLLAAPKLREDRPLVCRGRADRLSAAAIDCALTLDLPVADPEPHDTLDPLRWRLEVGDVRPLAALGADARFAPLLDAAIETLLGDAQAPLPERSGLGPAIERWVLGQLEHLADGALPRASRAVARLRDKAPLGAVPASVETLRRLEGLSVSSALARTLRGGVVDELGWPDLDAGLGSIGGEGLRFGGAFPNLVLWDGEGARVVGPKGWLAKIPLSLGPKAEPVAMRWVEGRIQVIAREPFAGSTCFWSGQEGPPEPTERVGGSLELEDAHPVDGGISMGGVPIRPDLAVLGRAAGVRLLCDGQRWWAQRTQGAARASIHTFDPETGDLGEASQPAFLADFHLEGWRLVPEPLELRPVPEGMLGSPLGARDGMLGWRVRSAADGELECESIDGRRWRGRLEDRSEPEGRRPREIPWGLIDWPGTTQRRLLSTAGDALKLWDAGEAEVLAVLDGPGAYAKGSALVMPPLWWHMLGPRDLDGSKALRRLEPKDAEALLSSWREGGAEACRAQLALVLPQITDARLVAGVLGVVSAAAEAERGLDAVGASWRASLEPAAALTPVERFFREGASAPQSFEKGALPWDMVATAGAWAFRAAALGTSEEGRARALGVLESWAGSVLSEDSTLVRAFDAVFEEGALPFAGPEAPLGDWGLEIEGHRYGLRLWQEWEPRRIRCRGLELSREGHFVDLPGASILSEQRSSKMPWSGRKKLQRLVELVRARGPLPWSEAISIEIARRTGLSEAAATYLWAGCPGMKVFRKDYLGTALRAELNLSVAEAVEARKTIQESSSAALRAQVWSEAMPDDPAALWTPLGSGAGDPDNVVARLCRAWNRATGRGPEVSERLTRAAAHALRRVGLAPEVMLAAVASPDTATIFQTDAAWRLTEDGQITPDLDPSTRAFFTGAAAVSMAHALPWLHGALPVGDPLQEGLAQLVGLTWKRLSNPELLFGAGNRSFVAPDAPQKALQFLETIGGAPVQGRVDVGPWLAAVTALGDSSRWSMVSFACRPAQMTDFEALGGLARDPFGAWRGVLEACRLLRSGGFAAMVDRLRSSPLDTGQWEANPLHSAAHTVEAVRRGLDLGEDAAVLYLQHLALAQLDLGWLAVWNGWDRGRLLETGEGLVARGLLERVGEEGWCVPGPRVSIKEASRPIEAFKLPRHGFEPRGSGWVGPLRRVLPLKPLHALFAEAWRRRPRF